MIFLKVIIVVVGLVNFVILCVLAVDIYYGFIKRSCSVVIKFVGFSLEFSGENFNFIIFYLVDFG